MPTYHIVWNADRTEGFITDDATDAAMTKSKKRHCRSALGGRFAELYDDQNLTMQSVEIHKPLSKAADKLLERIERGEWYRPHSGKLPKAMQELIDHKLVHTMGRIVTIEPAFVANGHTPFVIDKPPVR